MASHPVSHPTQTPPHTPVAIYILICIKKNLLTIKPTGLRHGGRLCFGKQKPEILVGKKWEKKIRVLDWKKLFSLAKAMTGETCILSLLRICFFLYIHFINVRYHWLDIIKLSCLAISANPLSFL